MHSFIFSLPPLIMFFLQDIYSNENKLVMKLKFIFLHYSITEDYAQAQQLKLLDRCSNVEGS